MDTGVHTLDTLLYWLDAFDVVAYQDDAFGGIEANCLIELKSKDGVSGQVELSRTRQLRNTYQFEFSSGCVEIGMHPMAEIVYQPISGDLAWYGQVTKGARKEIDFAEIMRWQIDDFLTAIETQGTPKVTGSIGRASIETIETCYAQKGEFDLPWLFPISAKEGCLHECS